MTTTRNPLTKWKLIEDRIARMPDQADPTAPHWIVINLSRYKQQPAERHVGLFFRHKTPEDAAAEAKRLAEKLPGRRFAVYGSGPSFKLDAPPETPPA